MARPVLPGHMALFRLQLRLRIFLPVSPRARPPTHRWSNKHEITFSLFSYCIRILLFLLFHIVSFPVSIPLLFLCFLLWWLWIPLQPIILCSCRSEESEILRIYAIMWRACLGILGRLQFRTSTAVRRKEVHRFWFFVARLFGASNSSSKFQWLCFFCIVAG